MWQGDRLMCCTVTQQQQRGRIQTGILPLNILSVTPPLTASLASNNRRRRASNKMQLSWISFAYLLYWRDTKHILHWWKKVCLSLYQIFIERMHNREIYTSAVIKSHPWNQEHHQQGRDHQREDGRSGSKGEQGHQHQPHFVICPNIFQDVEKYILPFGFTHFAIVTNIHLYLAIFWKLIWLFGQMWYTVIPAMVQSLFFDIIKQRDHKYAKPSPAVAADKTPVGAVAKNT